MKLTWMEKQDKSRTEREREEKKWKAAEQVDYYILIPMVCMAVKFNELRCVEGELTKYDVDRSLQVANSQASPLFPNSQIYLSFF